MKILLVADEEMKKIWDYYQPGMLNDYELILSAGDLDPRYLSFLATMSRAKVLYIHGNHDDKYEQIPPEGCECIDGQLYHYKGLRIVGLGGCMRYKDGEHMYSTQQMDRRVRKLLPKIFLNKGFDILLTHAPAYQVNDGEDLPHIGFPAFNRLMERYQPSYFIHGHIHKCYGKGYKQVDRYHATTVINCCGMYELEIPDPPAKKGLLTRKRHAG